MRSFFFLPIFLIVTSCTVPMTQTAAAPTTQIQLSQVERTKVAKKIWQNESAGKISGLTAWNEGENFPSLGIGHFIWYPKGVQGPFTESFPQFIKYAVSKGYNPPAVALNQDCPWVSRTQFKSIFQTRELVDLRNWLASNLTVQADFIIAKSKVSLGKMLSAAPATDRDRVLSNYHKVATTSNGTYALIDYVNFKGEGTSTKERYKGQGWGLLQVLQGRAETSGGQASALEFSRSAKRALDRRIANSNPSRGESRWRAGWHNRCDTYARPF